MTMVDDILFVDTNVLLTATDESRQLHSEALKLLSGIVDLGKRLAISGQMVREYLVVATRPVADNGLGLSAAQAEANVNEFSRRLEFYDETEAVSQRLRQLVTTHNLHGKRLHDANIVAAMVVHGICILLTQNGADFAPFTNDITIVGIPDVISETEGKG